jgi:hypothetical protein
MLIVLLQWLCSKVWESEFSHLWQHRPWHSVCSLVYLQATNSAVDCSLSLRISHNPVCRSHVTFILHDLWHSNSILSSSILKISGGRYNLWSYKSCSFQQFPITFSQKNLTTDQHCSQTQSTVFPQCHTHIKKYYVNTHACFTFQ